MAVVEHLVFPSNVKLHLPRNLVEEQFSVPTTALRIRVRRYSSVFFVFIDFLYSSMGFVPPLNCNCMYIYLLSYYDFFPPLLFRKYYTRSCKAFQVSSWSGRKVVPPLTNMKVSKLQKNLTKCSFMGALVEADGGTLSDWVPVADRALLMASIFLTYIAGVIPVGKQLTDVRDNANNTVPKNSNLSGR